MEKNSKINVSKDSNNKIIQSVQEVESSELLSHQEISDTTMTLNTLRKKLKLNSKVMSMTVYSKYFQARKKNIFFLQNVQTKICTKLTAGSGTN